MLYKALKSNSKHQKQKTCNTVGLRPRLLLLRITWLTETIVALLTVKNPAALKSTSVNLK